ncbi:MAG TPA: hypothetical protein PKD85_02810 [Saprospiraceae bacterium]|nr:hypothetical protein [Saprospiraceae bacterium]
MLKYRYIFTIGIGLGILFFLGCERKILNEVNCSIINEMLIQDQLYRADARINLIGPFADSLANGDSSQIDQYFEEAVDILRSKGVIVENKFSYTHLSSDDKKVVDSLWNLQAIIDSVNTKNVIKWLENVEYNRIDSLECYSDLFIVLAHSPPEQIEEILKLIENKRNYIHINSYNFINRVLLSRMSNE